MNSFLLKAQRVFALSQNLIGIKERIIFTHYFQSCKTIE